MPLPLLAAAGLGLGTGLLSGALSGLAGRKSAQQRTLENRFLASLNPEQQRADVAEDYYLQQAMAFDPERALRQYGDAASASFQRELRRQLRDLAGSAVGAGRLNTGFYDEDQGQLVSDLASRYNEAFASRALEAAGMNLGRIQDIGRFGERSRNNYLDLIASQLDREEAARNARRRAWTDAFGSSLGSAAMIYGAGR
jgi:hypothetical protein